MKTKSHKDDKINIITLGCSKNLVDSENLLTQLKHNDVDVTHQSEDHQANIYIINTCGFIDKAKEESINTILSYAKEKNENRIDKLYVTGCLSERYRNDLKKEIPEVDDWFGTLELPLLLNKFNIDYRHDLIGERITTTSTHYAYVKISEGCNRTCSFCAIPLMRGKHISKSMEDLEKEVRTLVSNGVKEIMLIAQELTYYGLDIYKERKLAELLTRLCQIEGLEWIRLHYAYPSKFPLEVIEVMAKEEKICSYLDMPLQHASTAVLDRMRRQINKEETTQLIQNIRSILPKIALRTTMLVGFPGETEEEFEELCNFVREMQFERLGVFTYSHEEDTLAHGLEDNVSDTIKQKRAETLMAIQQEISLTKNEVLIGQELKVLIDRKEGDYFVGRTEFDSPEVDNEVLIDANKTYCRIGDFVSVKIYDATDFDLYGTISSKK